MPCRSDKSTRGVARFGHLSDGNVHLVMVRKCSRLRYLRFLISMASGLTTGRSADGIVEVIPVNAVRFEPVQRYGPNSQGIHLDPNVAVQTCSKSEISASPDELGKYESRDQTRKPIESRSNKTVNNEINEQSHSSNSDAEVSSWNIDGELLHCAAITLETHRGAIEVFARGVEV